MGEKKIVVDKLRFEYEGLFKFGEVYKMIIQWINDKGYDRNEKYSHEKVTKTGKYVEIEMQPSKAFTDYVKGEIRVHIFAENLVEKDIVMDNKKMRMNHGKFKVVIDAFLNTDYEGKWEMNPTYYFLKTVFEKFAFPSELGKYEQKVVDEASDLHKEIKGFLNLYRVGYAQSAPAGPNTQF